MAEDIFDEIKRQLGHPFIRERRAAIEHIAERLQDPTDRAEALGLLKERAANDPIGIIRELAQEILGDDARQHPELRLGEGQEHVFGVICPKCQHTSFFNKREVCNKHSTFYRGSEEKGDRILHTLLLKCQSCDQEIKVSVDCEGYV